MRLVSSEIQRWSLTDAAGASWSLDVVKLRKAEKRNQR